MRPGFNFIYDVWLTPAGVWAEEVEGWVPFLIPFLPWSDSWDS